MMSVAALPSSSPWLPRRPRSAAQVQSLQPAALTFRDHRLQAGKQVGDDRIKSSHSDISVSERPDQNRRRSRDVGISPREIGKSSRAHGVAYECRL
ncbi:hypothetical protein BOSE62_130460 [Bosea sp. 62]|nr:hypothetical protein BOSE62_130460 [Bosea sp. 62]VXC24452.1 hypothetical protein BOSE29B_30419 [Bosea sp. 29B]VXC76180.1 hypothetical protein BOSE125_50091 [Bosea sp. 125]